MNGFSIIILLLLGVLGGAFVLLFYVEPESDEGGDGESSGDLSSVDDDEEILSLAEKYENDGEWRKALRAWSRYIELNPDEYDAYFRRGLVAYRARQYERTIKDFEEILRERGDPDPALHLHTARAYLHINNPTNAFSHYQSYFQEGSPEPDVIKEMGELAQKLEKWPKAKAFYSELQDAEDEETRIEATLALAEVNLKQNSYDEAKAHIETVKHWMQEGKLDHRQTLKFNYLQAQYFDEDGQIERANRIYRTIYQKDPSFRDVREIVEEHIANLNPEKLVRKFRKMDQKNFEDICRRIVEGMGYEVVESKLLNPEELEVVAREKSMKMNVQKALFAFKKWEERAGELAIKEFEFKIIEDRFDIGYYVNPSGFNNTGENYARGNDKLELMGAEQVLAYLEDWYQSEPH